MNRTLRWAILILSVLLVAAMAPDAVAAAPEGDAAHADHDVLVPTKGEDMLKKVMPAATALFTFAIVLAVLYVMVWPKISKGLDERATKIRDEIAGAELARKQAADALDEYEKNLADARAEAKAMLAETKAKQTELAAELRAKADAELTELRDRARQDIEAAKKAAVNEIYAESVGLASQIAGKILQREVTAQDQQRLVQESLAEMQANA